MYIIPDKLSRKYVGPTQLDELLIGAAISKDPPPLVTLSGALIDRVVTFKLLGVNVARLECHTGLAYSRTGRIIEQ